MEDNTKEKRTKWHWIIRILLRVFLVILALVIALVVAINIPAVQTFIAAKIIKSIREKTKTEMNIGSVKIAFPNTVEISELFIRDKNADTLLYMHSLHVDIDLFRLLRNTVSVNSLELKDVVANIHRRENEKTFNFHFILDAFAPDSTVKPDKTKKPGAPWLIIVKDISLANIRAQYSDYRTGFDGRFNLGELGVSAKTIDFRKKLFNLGNIALRNTSVKLVLSGHDSIEENVVVKTVKIPVAVNNLQSQQTSGIFLGLNILADQLIIENTSFSLDNASTVRIPKGIDYQHLHISSLNAGIRNINIDSTGYRADIQNMSLTESCGLNLIKLTADAQLTNQQAQLRNLQLETGKSKIFGEVSLGYPSFSDFLVDLWNSSAMLNIENTSVNADEVFLFVPFLASDKYVGKFKNSDVLISAKAAGIINDLNIENLELSLLHALLKTQGRLTGLPDMAKLNFDVAVDEFNTNLTDINRFLDPALYKGLKLPQSFVMKGNAKGKISAVKADFEITSAYGNIGAEAFYQNSGPGRRDTFAIDFTLQNIRAGVILTDTLLGDVSLSGKASGSGLAAEPMNVSGNIDIQEAQYNDYTYNDIRIESLINGKVISGTASCADTNLNFQLNANADLREAKQKYSARLDLGKLNLHALNFVQKDIAISTSLTAELGYEGLNNSEAHLGFINTTLIGSKKSMPVKELTINATSTPDSLMLEVHSDLADGTVSGNINSENLPEILQSAYKKYLGLTDTSQVQQGKSLAFNINMHIPQSIIDELLPELDTLRISKLEGIYRSDNNELTAELIVPEAIYSDAYLDSLSIELNGKNENLVMDFRLGKILYSNMQIKNLSIREQIDKGKISSEIRILDSLDNPRYLFANEIEVKDEFYKIRFLPNGLILDGVPWNVEEGNMLEKQQNKLTAHQFVFSNGNQSIGLAADDTYRKLSFTNFALQNLIHIVEFQGMKEFIKGDLVGDIEFPVSTDLGYINANLEIDSLYVFDTLAGRLDISIKTAKDKMDIDTRMVNDENKISIIGDVDQLSGSPLLNLNVLLDINNLKRLERLSHGYLSEMSGKIDGEMAVTGTPKQPEFNGFIGFEKTEFKVNSLNFMAKINDNKIQLDTKGIHFDEFVIKDIQNKILTVNGDVFANDFSNIGFDLHLVTKDFQPINSTSADNHVFYGKLSLATDIWVKGDLKNPDIEAQIKIDSATNLTYALPGSELKLVTSEGIVNFLEPGQSYDSIYIVEESNSLADSIMSSISGINLAVNLEIDPNARFTVDVDPKSGDYLTIGGSANLRIMADRSGKQSINGVYEVKSGLYQLSFYNLVKKTFTITPGSTVSWSGNPKDAELNLSASYVVTTPSTSLMANESVTMSETEKNMFKQRLPYGVKLNILGFLTQPKISFNITLPDKYLTANPMVASKLTLLNSEDHTDELNKQVFSLLVTGGFIADNPTATGSSPSSVASTAARNSVNGILAGQMNNVTSKYVRNFDVNFGLTTFDDGTTGSNDPTTELDVQVSKKLFNERVTIEAQSSFDLSGNKNPTTTASDHNSGELAVTYKLTQDGEYKLKAFSQTAYDLFDGDIISSGIAVLFTKEFDSLKKKKKVDASADKSDKQSNLENEKKGK